MVEASYTQTLHKLYSVALVYKSCPQKKQKTKNKKKRVYKSGFQF